MFAKKRLKELETQQNLLVVKADLHRQVLALEVSALRERFGWVGAVRAPLRAGRRWLVPVAVVAGLVAARQWRRLSRWLPVGFAIWRMVRQIPQR